MSSDSLESSEDEEYSPRNFREREHRTARKSTTSQVTQPYSTRRQAARNATKALRATSERFMANFNPETSVREKRKLNRKINPPSNIRRPAGAIYDENGVHISSLTDLCDCLNEDCLGCFFECAKCGSQKCGTDCRVHRKFLIDQIEYHVFAIVNNYLDTWTPFIRHIDEEEMNIYRYPSVHSYIKKKYLYVFMFAVPAIFYLLLYLTKRDEKTAIEIVHHAYGLTLAYCISATFTTFVKLTLGRPRPNFFLRCFPDGYGTNIDSCTGEYDGQMDGRKSFPSGHAVFSFTGMVYLTLHLFKLIDFAKPFRCRGVVFFWCTLPVLLATLVAVSRTCDYHHHYSDVVGGAMLGSTVAIIVFHYFGCSPDPGKTDTK
ncbi:hypothetical protein NQ318_006521 [Aromia moschata]|uniref:Phosphatidic acid phosphatase type 2/haloperoxidase domain-containing protein n=1 Tax=Aromia moschata TaxID=1265417 RepID=A0AAV8YPN7_9CUCU|nr:hypothetical protein NQ318_006521 [Aromia moschata]